MNKTVSINLGGFFFHIDEDAYQKLNRYFDAIKRSLSADGRDEIMNDIESRIAELLSEKVKMDKQVVGNREIDEIIKVMGQPEDYRLDEEEPHYTKTDSGNYSMPKAKKLYRDGDKSTIAGVAAGLGHYFNVDAVWIRIAFIISLFISFGTSMIIYIILWILIPKAITTTEKLEMRGEAITISNIEKKVREEFDNLSEKIRNVDYEKIGYNVQTGAERAGNALGKVFMSIFTVLGKILGALIAVFSSMVLLGLVISFFMLLFSSSMTNSSMYNYLYMNNYTEIPYWLVGLLGLLAIGIPFFALFLLGLKILVNNLRPIGNITKYTLLGFWIVSVIVLIYFGVRQAEQNGFDGKQVQREQINLTPTDTLYVKFRNNDYFSKSVEEKREPTITQDEALKEIIYSNKVQLHFLKTDEMVPYVRIEKMAEGSSMAEARNRAEKIHYSFEINGNKVILDNYLTTALDNKFRNQRVNVFIYLPKGFVVNADPNIHQYQSTYYSDIYIPSGKNSYFYKLEDSSLECLNCPVEKENVNHVLDDTQASENSDTIEVIEAVETVTTQRESIIDQKIKQARAN